VLGNLFIFSSDQKAVGKVKELLLSNNTSPLSTVAHYVIKHILESNTTLKNATEGFVQSPGLLSIAAGLFT
jgi:hypothetical protein